MRLIDADALMGHVRICKEAVSACANHDYMVGYASALSGTEGQIAAAPTINAEPVRHGRWVKGECSLCGEHAPYWCMASTYYKSPYCYLCGARMDLEEE